VSAAESYRPPGLRFSKDCATTRCKTIAQSRREALTVVLRRPGAKDRLPPVKTLKGTLEVCSIVALLLGATVADQARPIAATPVTTAANAEGQPAIAAQGMVFQTSVTPQPDEDLAAACRYESLWRTHRGLSGQSGSSSSAVVKHSNTTGTPTFERSLDVTTSLFSSRSIARRDPRPEGI
jgi:hypothetical protein